jgi:hypothetical protein
VPSTDYRTVRIVACATAALTLLLLPVGTAGAQERPPRPDDVSAISVYQEVMPTSAGPRVAPRTESPGAPAPAAPASAPLAPEVRRELRQAPREEANKLEEIATSSAHGAPAAPRAAPPPGERGALIDDEASVAGTTLEVASQSGRVAALILALAVATAAAAIVFVRRRRA